VYLPSGLGGSVPNESKVAKMKLSVVIPVHNAIEFVECKAVAHWFDRDRLGQKVPSFTAVSTRHCCSQKSN
jgi:hypothetical protein